MRGGGYLYFQFGEAEDWLDRTVNVATVNSLTMPEWMAEFDRLKDHGRQARQSGAQMDANQCQAVELAA